MDVLDDLLSGTRARGGVFNLTILDRPWGMEIADQAPLGLGAVLSGTAWVMRPGEEPVRLAPRDVAVLSGSEPYVVADSPDTRPTLRIHPGGSCEALPGARVDDSARLGTRTFGGRPDGEAWVVSGPTSASATSGIGCSVRSRPRSWCPPTRWSRSWT